MMMLLLMAPWLTGIAATDWQNQTVYRVTPMQDEGVTNMNTADAAGDVYFGVSLHILIF